MKNRLYKILTAILIAASVAVLFSGCMVNGKLIGISDYYYEDSDKYSIGNTELSGTVENIEIDWVAGNVKVLYVTSDVVSVEEKCANELTEDKQLRYWLDDTTLRIKFRSCGKDISETEKDLTVSVPDTLIFADIEVNSLSAKVSLENVCAETAAIHTVSGDIELSECNVTKSIEINTVSGKTNASLVQSLNEFHGGSTSGSFAVEAPYVSLFDIGTVSGEVQLNAQKEPERLDVGSTSGNIRLVLPKSASFTLEFDSVSGGMSSDLLYLKSNGNYVFGNGNKSYEISTVSGDLWITAK